MKKLAKHKNKAHKLAQLINAWLAAKPRRNLRQLSKRSGVSEMSIRRIYTGETKPTFETAVLLLDALGVSREEKYAYFSESFQHIVDKIQDWAVPQRGIELKEIPDEFLTDSEYFLILALASLKNGIALEEVERLLSLTGRDKIAQLVQQGIIVNDKGTLFVSEQAKKILLKLENIKKQAKTFLNRFHEQNIHAPCCFLHLETLNLTLKQALHLKMECAKLFSKNNDTFLQPHEADRLAQSNSSHAVRQPVLLLVAMSTLTDC